MMTAVSQRGIDQLCILALGGGGNGPNWSKADREQFTGLWSQASALRSPHIAAIILGLDNAGE
jgi:hypothetical protein